MDILVYKEDVYKAFEGLFVNGMRDVIDDIPDVRQAYIPKDCFELDITCDECDCHMHVSWCRKAIRNRKPFNKDYETGWLEGYDKGLEAGKEQIVACNGEDLAVQVNALLFE